MSDGPRQEEREALGMALASGLPYAGLAGREPVEGLVDPALQRELRIVPLGEGPGGELLIAAAEPDVDLSRLGRPALVAIAPRDELEALLPPAPRGNGLVAEPKEPEPDVEGAWEEDEERDGEPPPPAGLDDEPAVEAPAPRRRARMLAPAGLALLGAAAAAAVLVLLPRDEPTAPPPPDVIAVATRELGRDLLTTLPVPTVPRSRGEALRRACDGSAAAAVVTRPLAGAPCRLTAVAEATVGATVLLAPGGGCVSAGRARSIAVLLRRRGPIDRQPPGLEPVQVRGRGGACIGPSAESLTGGTFPLADVAVLAARGDQAQAGVVRDAARALPEVERSAPVVTLVVTRPLRDAAP